MVSGSAKRARLRQRLHTCTGISFKVWRNFLCDIDVSSFKEQAGGLKSKWQKTMAGRRLHSMLDGWLVRGEERRILATMEMDPDLGEEAEGVAVLEDVAALTFKEEVE